MGCGGPALVGLVPRGTAGLFSKLVILESEGPLEVELMPQHSIDFQFRQVISTG